MSRAPPQHAAQARHARGLPIARMRHALLVVACLVLLSLLWDHYSVDGTQGLKVVPRWSGFIQSAMAAEEPTDRHEVEITPAAVEDAALDEHAKAQVDERANFHDEAAAEAAAAEKVAEPADPDSEHLNLDDLSDEELKSLLSDKKKGRVNLKHYKGREALITAIREVESKETAQKAFRKEAALATRWYVETREELKYSRAAARRAKASRIKHGGQVPATLRSDHNADAPKHELRILYSEADGYGKHFTDLVKDLETLEGVKLPNLDAFNIVSEPYTVSKESFLLGHVLQISFYGVLALAIMPDLLPFLPQAVRNFLRTRRGLVLSTAFMLNMLSRSVVQTNAFEVYFDDELIYSTMKFAGRLPTSEMVSNMLLERTILKDYAAAMGRQVVGAATAPL
ncbi:hypothetical protein ABL78_7151 [Leptomonas seymouri]|uniref:Uncharacterized protein n=1 Tax=Leptomonas seymouri TaxID=5684 RepID=A0A0N1HUE3_LEPSE|nr:hypothetical protein ABL78_7151 [Leptomonas seymouri]|eukprot:KPI83803.1 hypothetical protein ABL78_7151 [Leptomonas seymouri]